MKELALYGEDVEQLAVQDTSRGEADQRRMITARCPDGRMLAVKAAKNSFTTPQRVQAWAALMEQYNRLGIYCPRMVPNRQGELCAWVDGFLVFAEEYAPFTPADRWKPPSGKRGETSAHYEEALYRSIGEVATHSTSLVPWHTAYCLYDRFAPEDTTDENYECALALRDLYAQKYPALARRAQGLFDEYVRRRQ